MTSTTPARPRAAMPATAPIRPPGAQPGPRPWTAVTRRALSAAATTGPRLPRDAQEPRAARRRLRFPVVLALAAAAVALLLLPVAPAAAASAAVQPPGGGGSEPAGVPPQLCTKAEICRSRPVPAGHPAASRHPAPAARTPDPQLCPRFRINCESGASARHPAARSTGPAARTPAAPCPAHIRGQICRSKPVPSGPAPAPSGSPGTSGSIPPTARTTFYSKAWTFKSSPLGVCVTFQITGNISYTYSASSSEQMTKVFTEYTAWSFNWDNVELNNLELEATVHAYSGGTCIGPGTVTSINMQQSWTVYSCSFNPSLMITYGPPSFSFWPSCGNRTVDRYYSQTSKAGSRYHQYNGFNVSFGSQATYTAAPPCWGVYVSGYFEEGTNTASYKLGPDSVCI